MIQTKILSAPKYNSFFERQAIERLLHLNHYFPTKSHYPIRRLRIKEKHIVPSNYQDGQWHLCPGCKHAFLEELRDYIYSYHPSNLNLANNFIRFDRKKWENAVYCCSKECLTKVVVRFALASVTDQGKKFIHMRRIRMDIKEVIENFH